MSVEEVKKQLQREGLLQDYREFDVSCATVELAARAIGCEEGRIAKTLAFVTREGPILIILMGKARIDNKRFKEVFAQKAIFPKPEDLPDLVGHVAGGVCPFAVREGIRVFLDESLRSYDPVYPSAGATNNAVRISLADLERITQGKWIRVSRD